MEHELHIFMVRVFAWIMGALLISAFFASYSDLWDESAVPILIGKTLLALTGGMFVLAFVISRKVAKMLPSVAMATLIAYASFQGILFGLTYRAAYHASLAGCGIDTSGWWERQLELALLGGFLQLGWSKTGDPAELGWWLARVVPTARDLLR